MSSKLNSVCIWKANEMKFLVETPFKTKKHLLFPIILIHSTQPLNTLLS